MQLVKLCTHILKCTNKMERYQLQYLDQNRKALAIAPESSIRENFLVIAITDKTDPRSHNRYLSVRPKYTPAYTLDQARSFIRIFNNLEGKCLGLHLEDVFRDAYFEKPLIFTKTAPAVVRPAMPDAAAIKYK